MIVGTPLYVAFENLRLENIFSKLSALLSYKTVFEAPRVGNGKTASSSSGESETIRIVSSRHEKCR
jgi:hypothetical protein